MTRRDTPKYALLGKQKQNAQIQTKRNAQFIAIRRVQLQIVDTLL
ncbi:Uncharacterised protein [Mycobacteroides abscessus subsp. abscessus]|nr:Uncharacterised protein [Mycobacteroides abscessus subsp. abscessus]SII33231.1 Uncharacterised protein [Mycobacteroides abscessus subsp. abscessus]SII65494.1 Uncharacterised protein [Mycobacteroides abscessus subsp. abscessus]